MAAVLAGLFALALSALPMGFVLCVERDGTIAVELVEAGCCALASRPLDAAVERSAHPCEECTDLVPSHVRSLRTQQQPAPPATGASSRPVIAIIAWPPVDSRRGALAIHGGAPPPHLIQISTVVIRC